MSEKEFKTTLLSGEDVSTIVQRIGPDAIMDKLISRMRKSIRDYNPKNTIIPIRSGFNYGGDHPGLVEWMPVHQKGDEVVIKVVGYHPKNPKTFNLPTILSSISSYDTRTGHLNGIADGVLLTALRTGAASAVASELMALPESSVLGLIGCGAQSVTQLHALSRIFSFERILIYDIDPEAMVSFVERISMLNLEVAIEATNIELIVGQSDIVCSETSIDIGQGPLFETTETRPHLHINAVGSDFPGKIELPLAFSRQSFVCPDFLEQAKIEGECQQLDDSEIDADLAQLVQEYPKYADVRERTSVFDSTGWALEDKVVMDMFLDLSKELGIGRQVAIENVSEDAKNPYHFLLKPVEA